MALPIWGFYMKAAYNDPRLDISKEPFEKPDGLAIELNCDSYVRSQNIFDTQDAISW
jgi:penicillin-binding protein 1A